MDELYAGQFPEILTAVYPILYNYSYLLAEGIITVIIICNTCSVEGTDPDKADRHCSRLFCLATRMYCCLNPALEIIRTPSRLGATPTGLLLQKATGWVGASL